MGSEFAYEDLSSFEIEKYRFNYLKDDSINGQDVFVVEQIPTDKNSGYTKQTVWLDKAHYRPLKVEFYDRKGSLLKTLFFFRLQAVPQPILASAHYGDDKSSNRKKH